MACNNNNANNNAFNDQAASKKSRWLETARGTQQFFELERFNLSLGCAFKIVAADATDLFSAEYPFSRSDFTASSSLPIYNSQLNDDQLQIFGG
jgi:hypothetical protein